MTNPILDRVAKAIEEAPAAVALENERGIWEVFWLGHAGTVIKVYDDATEAIVFAMAASRQSRARAAIEAFGEPRKRMIDADPDVLIHFNDGEGGVMVLSAAQAEAVVRVVLGSVLK